MKRPIIAAAVALLLIAASASAADLTGAARVIDGDTIELAGRRIRLWGIDAPESRQTCQGRDGNVYECGRDSAAVLTELTRGRTVTCEQRDRDRYRRIVAVCRTEAGEINAAMVRRGWAVDYVQFSRGHYRAEEAAAKREALGIWSGRFDPPSDWRRGQQRPAAATQARRDGCNIKGNINSRGERIYHVPGGRWYAATKIDESKDERWFCTEREARAAGWRLSR